MWKLEPCRFLSRVGADEHAPFGIRAIVRTVDIAVNRIVRLIDERARAAAVKRPNPFRSRRVRPGNQIVADVIEPRRPFGGITAVTGLVAPVKDHIVDEVETNVVAQARIAAVVMRIQIMVISHQAI